METRQKKMEENQTKILEAIGQLKTCVEDLKLSVEHSIELSQQASKQATVNTQRIEVMQTELDCEKLKNAKLALKLESMSERMIKVESQSRRDNLLIDGVSECDPKENCTITLRNVLKSKLSLGNVDQIEIVRCHRLGPKREHARRPRTIIVKFQRYSDRMRVWEQRKKLKGSEIFIEEDFPREIQERRRILAPIMKKARALGKNAFLNVDALIIDGVRYGISDIPKLSSELSPANIATPHVAEDAIAFFSSQSPLSNFFMSPFEVEGQRYDCVERYYQKEKAEFFGDQLAVGAIMKADTALECYRIGRTATQHRNITQWRQKKAHEVMYNALKAKYTQSTYLKHFLCGTEGSTLIEANQNDQYWSCGLSLKHPGIASKEQWKGENMLGNMLMKVRSEILLK